MNADRQRIPTYKPPPDEAQGGNTELCLAAMLDAPPQSTLTPQKYPLLLSRGKGSSICCYCQQMITPTDDAQLISKRIPAHTLYAFGANDNFLLCSMRGKLQT